MSAIKDLVSNYNDMCGEGPTEMGDAALGELNDMLAKLSAAEKLAETAKKWVDGDVSIGRHEVMYAIEEWEKL